jgi:DNA-damage-inducible protein J
MAKTAYINTRIDKKLKADTEKVLEQIGVSTSDLMTMTFKQVVIQQGLPFEVRIPNKETRKAIRDLEAGKGKIYRGSTKDIFDSLLKKR